MVEEEASEMHEDDAEQAPKQGRAQGVRGRQAHVPADIRSVSFPVSVRGYDRRAVDAYVQRVNRVIAELEVSRSPQAAEKITDAAREEAEQILAGAKAEAAELVVNASAEADRLGAEAQQVLADARAAADDIIAHANADAAERRRQADEEIAAL